MRLRVELELDNGRIVGASRKVILSGTASSEVREQGYRMLDDIIKETFR